MNYYETFSSLQNLLNLHLDEDSFVNIWEHFVIEDSIAWEDTLDGHLELLKGSIVLGEDDILECYLVDQEGDIRNMFPQTLEGRGHAIRDFKNAYDEMNTAQEVC